jgi:hypothetical protein
MKFTIVKHCFIRNVNLKLSVKYINNYYSTTACPTLRKDYYIYCNIFATHCGIT